MPCEHHRHHHHYTYRHQHIYQPEHQQYTPHTPCSLQNDWGLHRLLHDATAHVFFEEEFVKGSGHTDGSRWDFRILLGHFSWCLEFGTAIYPQFELQILFENGHFPSWLLCVFRPSSWMWLRSRNIVVAFECDDLDCVHRMIPKNVTFHELSTSDQHSARL